MMDNNCNSEVLHLTVNSTLDLILIIFKLRKMAGYLRASDQ